MNRKRGRFLIITGAMVVMAFFGFHTLSRRFSRNLAGGVERLEARDYLTASAQPVTLSEITPLGGMVFQAESSGELTSGIDLKQYSFELGSPQLLNVILEPGSSDLRLAMRLTGPDGEVVDESAAPSAGAAVLAKSLHLSTPGAYTVSVTDADAAQSVATNRTFTTTVVSNAAIENESYGGAANNSATTSQVLDSLFASLGDDLGTRVAILGQASSNPDFYRLSLGSGESASFVVAADSPGISIRLYDGALRPVASGIAIEAGGQAIQRFRDTSQGGSPQTYFVEVFGVDDNDAGYRLVVTRNADLDTQTNHSQFDIPQLTALPIALQTVHVSTLSELKELAPHAAPGTHFVLSGVYTESDVRIRNIQGTAENPIVIRGDGTARLEPDGWNAGEFAAILDIHGEHVIIDNLAFDSGPAIEQAGQAGRLLNISSAHNFGVSKHITVQNCTFTRSWRHALFAAGESLNMFANEFYGNALYNEDHTRGVWPFAMGTWTYQTELNGPRIASQYVQIIGNSIYGNHGEGLHPSYARNVTVAQNEVRDNLFANIALNNTAHARVFGNTIGSVTPMLTRFGEPPRGIDIWVEQTGENPLIANENIIIENNTIDGGEQLGIRKGITWHDESRSLDVAQNTYANITIRGNTIRNTSERLIEFESVNPHAATPTGNTSDMPISDSVAYSNLVGWTIGDRRAAASVVLGHLESPTSQTAAPAKAFDVHYVDLTGGETLTLSTYTPFAEDGLPANPLDPLLRLYDPLGRLVAEDDNSSSDGKNAQLSYTSENSGLFKIVVATSHAVGGDYHLRIDGASHIERPLNVAGSSLPPGVTVESAPVELRVHFNQLVRLSSLTATDFHFDSSTAASIKIVDGDTVLVTPRAPLATGTHHWSLAAGAMQDIAGVSNEAYSAEFSVAPPGSIAGIAFADTNGNGQQEAGELPLAEWTIYVDSDADGELDADEPATLTDASGMYSFTGLKANATHVLRQIVPSGWRQVAPNGELDFAYEVELLPEQAIADAHFANQQLTTALRVDQVEQTSNGVVLFLTAALNPALLNLYDGPDAATDAPDAILRAQSSGDVAGSLIWRQERNALEFVATSGELPTDLYEFTLLSNDAAAISADGELLDGDADNTPGGAFVYNFSTLGDETPALSIQSFARGPGQRIELNEMAGLPIQIFRGSSATSVRLEFQYDVDAMHVLGAAPSEELPADWTVVMTPSETPGSVVIEASGATPLNAGNSVLMVIQADVPVTAPLNAHVLRLANVEIDEVAIADASAVQVPISIGDVTAEGGFSSLDATYIARVAVGLDSGFDAFPNIDPVIIGDISGSGDLTAYDAALVARRAVQVEQYSPALAMASVEEVAPTVNQAVDGLVLALATSNHAGPLSGSVELQLAPEFARAKSQGISDDRITTSYSRQTQAFAPDEPLRVQDTRNAPIRKTSENCDATCDPFTAEIQTRDLLFSRIPNWLS
ncbi:MAG: right-handed parallel beta-helix repeat-containing protein [Planctomycetales bacterium]|nr:right-handed parallel beta-helix repeat-containing protein [Planctomycetales bacterium]